MRYDSLSLDRLKELLAYDAETGVFTWKQRPFHNSRKRVGDVAGVPKGNGYRYIGLDSRQYMASQLAWFYVHGTWARGQVGVKDGDPANLRADNLVEMPGPAGKFATTTRDGLVSYRKAYRQERPELMRDREFRRLYGIGIDEYQRMLGEQNGVCGICEQPERAKSRWNPDGEPKWLSVDHDHETGAVRGLLCTACNRALGYLRDDPSLLRRAADYLDRHASKVVAIPKKDSA